MEASAIAYVVTVLASALTEALLRLQGGGSLDDALATAIEHIADKKAKSKWPNFRP